MNPYHKDAACPGEDVRAQQFEFVFNNQTRTVDNPNNTLSDELSTRLCDFLTFQGDPTLADVTRPPDDAGNTFYSEGDEINPVLDNTFNLTGALVSSFLPNAATKYTDERMICPDGSSFRTEVRTIPGTSDDALPAERCSGENPVANPLSQVRKFLRNALILHVIVRILSVEYIIIVISRHEHRNKQCAVMLVPLLAKLCSLPTALGAHVHMTGSFPDRFRIMQVSVDANGALSAALAGIANLPPSFWTRGCPTPQELAEVTLEAFDTARNAPPVEIQDINPNVPSSSESASSEGSDSAADSEEESAPAVDSEDDDDASAPDAA